MAFFFDFFRRGNRNAFGYRNGYLNYGMNGRYNQQPFGNLNRTNMQNPPNLNMPNQIPINNNNSSQQEPRQLPDGVTMHPINQDIYNEIKKGNMGALNSIGADTHNALPSETADIPQLSTNKSNGHMSIYERLITDEHNASIFYKYLSEVAPYDRFKKVLSVISESCRQRCEDFGVIYNDLSGSKFEILPKEINQSIGFSDGLYWAISVENNSLRSLCDLLDTSNDPLISKKLSSHIYRKICDISNLHLLRNGI